MFYKTRIKSVTNGGAIDVNGTPLTFIGYLPVKAGDTVFTDGKVIFGNAPPKGSPAVFDVPSGIPVLGDENLLSDKEEELRGYFTRNGTFRKFNVAQDDWITNSDKEFTGGEEKFEDEKVIDAFINKSREKLVLTGGIYRDSHTLDLTGVRLSFLDYRTWYYQNDWYSDKRDIPCNRMRVYKQTLGSEKFPDDDEASPATIFVNDKKEGEIDLEKYAKDIEERASECAEKIMEQAEQAYQKNGENLSIQRFNQLWNMAYYEYSESEAQNEKDPLVAKAAPDEPFTAYTIAYIQTANFNEDGFSGTVFAATYGYCFPYIQPRFKYGWHWYTEHWDKIFEKITGGGESEGGESEGAIEYPDDMFLEEWKCVPFGCSAIYKIAAGEEDDVGEPIVFREFGGIDSDVMVIEESDGCLVDSVRYSPVGLLADVLKKRQIELKPNDDDDDDDDKVDKENLLPVGEGFFWMDKFGRLSFYNSDKEEIAKEIPIHDDLVHIEIHHGEYYADQIRYPQSYTPEGQSEFGDQSLLFFNDKPYLHCKVYTSDGEVKTSLMFIGGAGEHLDYKDDDGNVMEKLKGEQAKLYGVMYYKGAEPEDDDEEEDPLLPMDGYYIKKADDDDEDKIKLEPLQFTPLFYQFQNGSYLYGVKDGKLYLKEKDDNEGKEVGDKIKNFRLEELRAVAKSRKSKK